MVLYILILKFLEDGKTKDPEENGSKHSLNLICFSFFCACNFDQLLLFPNTITLLYFRSIYYYLSVKCDFILHSGDET
jgi:hypothetical protein